MVIPFENMVPETADALFIAWNAHVCGNVRLGKDSSVWYGTTLRGDIAPITIGEGTNFQDNSVGHISTDIPLIIGNFVTIGHGVILHSCTIADHCLIGMGATLLDNVEIGEFSIVAAGSLVPPGKKFPPRSLIMGNPARVVRGITPDDEKNIQANAQRYIENALKFSASDKKNLKFSL